MNSSIADIYTNTKSTEKKPACFSEFYNKYAGALYGIILRIVDKEIIAAKVLEKVFKNAFVDRSIKAPKLISEFTAISNHSRKKSQETLKAIKMFQTCNESCECIALSK